MIETTKIGTGGEEIDPGAPSLSLKEIGKKKMIENGEKIAPGTFFPNCYAI